MSRRFGKTPTCDRQTDGRIHDYAKYRAIIASRGKIVHIRLSVQYLKTWTISWEMGPLTHYCLMTRILTRIQNTKYKQRDQTTRARYG